MAQLLGSTPAAKDAEDVCRVLERTAMQGAKVLLRTDSGVTRKTLDEIRVFLAEATENDEVILFCAGHGVVDGKSEYLFAGHGFSQMRSGSTGMKLEELLGLLDEVKAYKRLLLLDTGFSGKLGESGRVALQASQTQGGSGQEGKRGILMKPSLWSRIKEIKPLDEGVFERKGEHRGLIVIGSSGGAEQAWESDAAKNGVFSAAIIESMTKRTADVNEDGMVTALELASHVCDRVLKETRGKQAPVVWMSETGHDFALAPGVSGAERIKAAANRETADGDPGLGKRADGGEGLYLRLLKEPDVAKLDKRLQEIYDGVRKRLNLDGKSELRREQIDWIAARNEALEQAPESEHRSVIERLIVERVEALERRR